MKKIFVILATLFLFVGGVSAKEIIKQCSYKLDSTYPPANVNALVEVYDDNSYKVRIYYFRYGSLTSVDAKNGKVFDPYIPMRISEGECPLYLRLYQDNSNSGVTVHISDSDQVNCSDHDACIVVESPEKRLSQEEINAGNKLIDEMLISLKSQIDKFKNYDIRSSECYKPLTSAGYSAIAPYEDCIDGLKKNNIYTTNAYSEVMNLKNSNEYWQKSEKMAECEEAYKKYDLEYTYLMTTLEHAANEETIKSCEENKQIAGNTAFDSCIKEGKEKREEFEKQLDALRRRAADIEGEEVEISCEGLIGKNTLELLRVVRNIIMTVGPILAAVLGTYDMLQAMASGEDDAKKKAMKKFKGRLIAAVLLLLAPYIIYLLLQISNKAGADCITPIKSTAQTEYIVNDMSKNILK